jgi:hypothetical protein
MISFLPGLPSPTPFSGTQPGWPRIGRADRSVRQPPAPLSSRRDRPTGRPPLALAPHGRAISRLPSKSRAFWFLPTLPSRKLLSALLMCECLKPAVLKDVINHITRAAASHEPQKPWSSRKIELARYRVGRALTEETGLTLAASVFWISRGCREIRILWLPNSSECRHDIRHKIVILYKTSSNKCIH